MRIFVNFSLYVLITCMLIFVNQQAVGWKNSSAVRAPPPKLIKEEDGTTHIVQTPVVDKGYESAWSDDSGEGLRLMGHAKDIKETLSVQNTRLQFAKIKTSKDKILMEGDLKKLGSSLFKSGKNLGLLMKNDSDYDSDQGPSETSDERDSSIEEKHSFTKIFSTIDDSLHKTKYKDINRIKVPKHSLYDTPKSSTPATQKTESKHSITENISTIEHFLKSRGADFLKHHTQKGSKNFVFNNNYEAPKFSNSEASTTENKQSADIIMSTIENSFITNKEYLGLPMQNESEKSVQKAPKTDSRASVAEKNQSFPGVKSLLGNSIDNKKGHFGFSRKKGSEKNIQETSVNISPDASETGNQKASESSAPEASKTEVKSISTTRRVLGS